MNNLHRLPAPIAALSASLLLSACAGGAGAVRSPTAATTGDRPAANAYAGVTNVRPTPGSDAIIGRNAGELTRLLGTPRLSIALGNDGQKLQFGSDRCVLDAYLYPPTGGGEPVVAHVDARNGDGADVDRAACIAALRRR